MRYLITGIRHRREYEWTRLRPWQKHSEVLAMAGVVYILVGLSYILIPIAPDRRAALQVLAAHVPMRGWGVLWVSVGALALASTRWPPASKTWGYTLLTAVAALWSSAYLVGVLFLNAPPSGLLGALVWGLVAYLWYAVAGLANPDDLYITAPGTEEQAVADETRG